MTVSQLLEPSLSQKGPYSYEGQQRNRTGPFGIPTSSSNNGSSKGFGSGFGNGSDAWNNGIWSGGNPAIGSGLKNGMQDNTRGQRQSNRGRATDQNHTDALEVGSQVSSNNVEAITGSRSLLPSSELDGFNPRHGAWKSVDDTSPGLSRVNTNNSNTSPIQRQNSNLLVPQPFNDSSASTFPYSSMNTGSTTISSRSSQKNFLDPSSGTFSIGAFDSANASRTSRHNSDEENRYAARKMAFEGLDPGLGMQSTRQPYNTASGYASSAASRSGSMPPSRNDVDMSTRYKNDTTNTQASRFSIPSSQRQNLSARAPPYITTGSGQKYGEQLSPSQMNQVFANFNNLDLGRENQRQTNPTQSEVSYGSSSGFSGGYNQEFMPELNQGWNSDEAEISANQEHPFSARGNPALRSSNTSSRRAINLGPSYSQAPSIGDPRLSHNSPYYSAGGTPPSYQQHIPSRVAFGGTLVK